MVECLKIPPLKTDKKKKKLTSIFNPQIENQVKRALIG